MLLSGSSRPTFQRHYWRDYKWRLLCVRVRGSTKSVICCSAPLSHSLSLFDSLSISLPIHLSSPRPSTAATARELARVVIMKFFNACGLKTPSAVRRNIELKPVEMRILLSKRQLQFTVGRSWDREELWRESGWAMRDVRAPVDRGQRVVISRCDPL